MSTLAQLKYRTFDELLDSVMIDFQAYNSDNSIDPAELIKIAQKCTYELGLKIYQTKETILDIEHGTARLPGDFHILDFALLCHHFNTITPSLTNGLQTHDTPVTSITNHPNLTTCPCWDVVSTGVQVPVVYCDTDVSRIVSISAGTFKICAKSIDVLNATGGTITVSTDSFCYNDYNTGAFTCALPPSPACPVPDSCGAIEPDPWFQNKVYHICNDTIGVKVIQDCKYFRREYTSFSKVYMVPSREATTFCINTQFRDAPNRAQIKNGFVYTSVECGKLYICYEGAMENEQGELLVLDHPFINSFYTYALKKRILENLYLNGDPDLERRLQYVNEEYKKARAEAMAITSMPDYSELCNAIDGMRLDSYSKYIEPFQRAYWPFHRTDLHEDY